MSGTSAKRGEVWRLRHLLGPDAVNVDKTLQEPSLGLDQPSFLGDNHAIANFHYGHRTSTGGIAIGGFKIYRGEVHRPAS